MNSKPWIPIKGVGYAMLNVPPTKALLPLLKANPFASCSGSIAVRTLNAVDGTSDSVLTLMDESSW